MCCRPDVAFISLFLRLHVHAQNASQLHGYAVRALYRALQQAGPAAAIALLTTATWCIGARLAETAPCMPAECSELLAGTSTQLPALPVSSCQRCHWHAM